MKNALALITLLVTAPCFAQCPFPVTITAKGGLCLGSDTLVVSAPGNNISKTVWYNGNSVDTIVTDIAGNGYLPYGVTVVGGNAQGSGSNQFNNPWGVFVDASGNIFVADTYNHRVLKFPFGSTSATSGIIVAGGSGFGSAANQLEYPTGVYVDGGGNLYVTDNSNNRIQKFPPGSTSATNGITVAGGNGLGFAPNQLSNPSGIFFDTNGNMYIADAYNYRIQKFPPGSSSATNGVTVAGGNGQGAAANQLDAPTSVHVDPTGTVYVADLFNNRIQKFPPGSTSATDGVTVAGGNGSGTAANQFIGSSSVFLDGSGNIYVADEGNGRILKFPPNSTSSTNGVAVVGGNGPGANPNQLLYPDEVFIDAKGNMYVDDNGNSRIQKFSPGNFTQIDTAYIPTAPGTYTAVITDSAGCTVTTNAITINPTVTPSISISGVANTLAACSAQATDTVSFAATASNGGLSPSYQWQVNGIDAGGGSPTFTAALANTSIVTCTLASNAMCASPVTVVSNSDTVRFGTAPNASLVNKGSNCLGSDTLVVSAPGILSKITWYNGNTVDTTVNAVHNGVFVQDAATVAGGNGSGSAANQLNRPNAVCIDGSGNIYIADLVNNRIQKFPPGSTSASNGITVAGGNGTGFAANQFQPNAVFVDAAGYIYVADNFNNRVQKFPPGSTGASDGITVAGGNGFGSAANQFNNPVSVYVDGSGYLYVVDAVNERIQKFPPGSTGATNGVTVAGGNAAGQAANQLNGPGCVFLDGEGNIYVADGGNERVQKFPANSTSATNGITVAGGNGAGAAANQLNAPSSVFVDGGGYIYVADVKNQRIQKFPPNSNTDSSGATVAGGNGAGNAPNQFNFPFSVCTDATGNIYVADINNDRIQKFFIDTVNSSKIDTVLVPTSAGSYTAMVAADNGCAVTTTAIVINTPVTPAISISVATASSTPCNALALDTVSFKASETNGGTAPIYQWRVNGVNLGTDTAAFTAGLANNSVVTCTVTSNAVCASPATVVSNRDTVKFNNTAGAALKLSGGPCAGMDTLVILSYNRLATITWYSGNTADTTVNDAAVDTIYLPGKPGTYMAAVITSFGCKDTTNAITIAADIKPAVTISADANSVCAGNPITFTASTFNAGSNPAYQWLVNGTTTSANGATYTSNTLVNGDAVACLVSNTSGCILTDTSGTITAAVLPQPKVGQSADVTIQPGQSITIALPVTGDIAAYLWSPPTGLSNDTIASPLASPGQNTTYTLKATSPGGCAATGTVTVKVAYPISIPGAFTPNGDGHNDVFYVLGGYTGDKIKSFSVYGRWGQRLFQVQNVPPNDPGYGWNGTVNGLPQQPGAYVYVVIVAHADGSEKVYKGTVVLVR